MKIRKAKSGDEEQIKELVSKCIYQIFKKKARNLGDLEDIKKNYLVFYVVEIEGRIVGCGGLEKEGKKVRLKRMYLNRKYRGKGIGEDLLDRLIKFCRRKKYESVILTTYPKMKEGLKFYERQGFKRVKKKDKEVHMEKKLK